MIAETLEQVQAVGGYLYVHDGRLRIHAPGIDAELLERLRQLKPQLWQVVGQCEVACHGLTVSPAVVFGSLSPIDVQALIDGTVSAEGLRIYAQSLATGIHAGRVVVDDHGRVLSHFAN